MDRVALPVEPERMHMRQYFPKELWDRSEEHIRNLLERDWAIRLWEWIREQPGEVQLGVRRESVVTTNDWFGGLGDGITLWWEITATPIGRLVPGEFYFYGGSLHGRWMATDGSPTWMIPVYIPSEALNYGISATDELPVIVDVYERDGGVYRYARRDKR